MAMKRSIAAALAVFALLPAAGERVFNHPGLSYSAEEIAEMRRQIAAHAEPAYSTFEALKKNGYSALTDGEPEPVSRIESGKFNNTVGVDGRKAHDLALLYVLTDDTRYADEALKHIDRYNTLVSAGARGTGPLDNGKIYLLLEAAELLRDYDGWSTADREQFCDMLVAPGYSDSEFPQWAYSTDDAVNAVTFYWNICDFDVNRWGNQGLFAARGLMAMGIFLDNEKIYDRALRYVMARESRSDDLPFPMRRPERVSVNSESDYLVDYKNRWTEADREFFGDEPIPYYIYQNGQCQESCRDQGHVMAGLGQLVDLAEMAWHQGDDLYGAYDSRILLGLEWSLRYCLSAIQGKPWEPMSYSDYESRCTFDNGYFYRADSRSLRWRGKKPYDADRTSALNNVRYLNQALAHYRLRTDLPASRYEWLQKAVDYLSRLNGGVENWGSSGHHYEWKGWGTLTHPLNRMADGSALPDADATAADADTALFDLQGRPAGMLGDAARRQGVYVTSSGRKLALRR